MSSKPAQSNASNASAFTTLSPFKSVFHALWEVIVLGGASFTRRPEHTMRKQAFLHHAYWLRLRAGQLRASPAAPTSARGALLFMSCFKGNLTDYLRGFTAALPTEMDLIWDCSDDWPGAKNNRACAEFIEKYAQTADLFFSAYGRAGIRDVRLALRLRAKLDEFATEFATAGDRQFEHAFHSLATSLLTDPDGNQPDLG